MKEYFEIGLTVPLLLFSLVAIKISHSSFLIFIPYLFLFSGSAAMRNSLLYEIHRIYSPDKFSSNHREMFRISLILLLFSVLSAYYVGKGIYFMIASVLFSLSHAIKVRFSFLSDLVYALSLFFVFLFPYFPSSLSTVPFAWAVALMIFLRGIVQDLVRPFGIERFNLPKILGVRGTKNTFIFVSFIVFFWLALPSIFYQHIYPVLYEIPFSFLAISDYLVFTDRSEEARSILYLSLISYLLPALFL